MRCRRRYVVRHQQQPRVKGLGAGVVASSGDPIKQVARGLIRRKRIELEPIRVIVALRSTNEILY
jgi:hypothetical protein